MIYEEYVNQRREQIIGYFREKDYPTEPYGFKLDRLDHWYKNILDNSVVNNINRLCFRHSSKVLHKEFLNGLSSQACCFNLFGPLFCNQKSNVIKRLMRLANIDLFGDIDFTKCFFEYEDRLILGEKDAQPTSVDILIETNKNERVIIEFKFTESGFGKCSVHSKCDCCKRNPKDNFSICYLHKRGRKYLPLMEQYNLFSDAEICPLKQYYQAYRMLLFALESNGHFLLIHDKRNPAFICNEENQKFGLFQRFAQLLPEEISNRVHQLSIQDIVDELSNFSDYPWLPEFRRKYL